MLTLAIKTDQVEASIALFKDDSLLEQMNWSAHRQLAETIHRQIKAMLDKHGYGYKDIGGIVCYKGPGSFTGLRIGLSVGNALAYGIDAQVVSQTGNDWQSSGIKRLQAGDNEITAMPEYGAEVHITQPRK